MRKPELYKKTVDILYASYFNNTLQYGHSCACAIGNLVAANMGLDVVIVNDKAAWFKNGEFQKEASWSGVFCSEIGGLFQKNSQTTDLTRFYGDAKKEIISTGYSIQELANIEYAFESGCRGLWKSEEKRMYDGLVAVLQELSLIHEITIDENNLSKLRFSKHYSTIK